MDLSNYTVKNTSFCKLVDGTGDDITTPDGSKVGFEIHSMYSDVYEKAEADYLRKIAKKKKIDPVVARKMSKKLAIACINRAVNIEHKGQPLQADEDSLNAFFQDFPNFLAQVVDYHTEEANFL